MCANFFSFIETFNYHSSSTLFETLPTLDRFLSAQSSEIKKKIIKNFNNNLKIQKVEFNYPNSKKNLNLILL